MSTLAATPSRHALHPLRVASVERLTEDSIAIAFDVPEELRDVFAFAPGQHVAVVRSAGGDEVRRSYSICSPAGGPLRVAVKRLPAAGSRPTPTTISPRATSSTSFPRPATSRRRWIPSRPTTTPPSRRQRHHAGHLDRPERPRGRAGEPLHAGLRQPDRPLDHVPRGARGLKNRHPARFQLFTCCPGSRRRASSPRAASRAPSSSASWTA